MKKRWVFTGLLLSAALAACGNADKQDDSKEGLKKTTVVLDWTPNTNHTGLYTALENGYYKDAGLDVEIVQPADGSASTLVAAGKGDFGISSQEDITYALTSKDKLPIKAIAAVIQHNTSGFAAPKSKGITSPKDFEGKVYGGWGSPSEEAILKSVMKDAGADYSKLKVVNIGSDDFFASTQTNTDFSWIFEGWVGIEAKLKGVDLDYMPVADLNPAFDYYTPVLFTSDSLTEKDPEKIKAFMAATAKGYEYAIENPEKSAKILLKHAPEISEELALKSQDFLSKQYKADADQWGVMKEKVWSDYAKFLDDNNLLESKLDVDKAFTNDYLPKK